MREGVEFILREKGDAEKPNCTVEVQFNLSTRGVAFKDELKEVIPRRRWHYDPELHRWFIALQELDRAITIARKHFDHVYKTEGTRRVDVVTGASQEGLF
jgi:hypothetical protein